jgi:hypothetical protein
MEGQQMALLKEGAKKTIQTLMVADRVTIVTFGDNAAVIGESSLQYEAPKENIQVLFEYVDNLDARRVCMMHSKLRFVFSKNPRRQPPPSTAIVPYSFSLTEN